MYELPPFMQLPPLPPAVARLFVQVFALLWGLGYGFYGVVALDRFAVVCGIVLLFGAVLVGHLDFENGSGRLWREAN